MKKISNVLKAIDWKKVSPSVWARYIVGVVATINMIFTALGCNPIPYSEDKLYIVVSSILQLVVIFMNTYMNNSTSGEAITADQIMYLLKSGLIEIDDMVKLIDSVNKGTYKKPDLTEDTNTNTTDDDEGPEFTDAPLSEDDIDKILDEDKSSN